MGEFHPHHENEIHDASGWQPFIPEESKRFRGLALARKCLNKGGHWWHPTDEMTEWGCCQCGTRRGGNPKDGT